jgi:hypothetical protein
MPSFAREDRVRRPSPVDHDNDGPCMIQVGSYRVMNLMSLTVPTSLSAYGLGNAMGENEWMLELYKMYTWNNLNYSTSM